MDWLHLVRMDRIRTWMTAARDALMILRQENVTFAAAGIAYYILVAVVPVLLLLFVGLTSFGGEAVARSLLFAIEDWLTPEGYTLVEEILTGTSGRGQITAIGAALFFWSTYRVLHGFELALSRIYGDETERRLRERVTELVTVLVLIGGAVFGTVTIAAGITALSGIQFIGALGNLLQFIVLSLVFLLLYSVFSGRSWMLAHVLPGAVVAAGGWTVLQFTFSIYTTYVTSSVYDLFGGLLLFVTWIYLGVLLILFGATYNVALHRTG